jgi:hypothetical protein
LGISLERPKIWVEFSLDESCGPAITADERAEKGAMGARSISSAVVLRSLALIVPLVLFALTHFLPHYLGLFGSRWSGFGEELQDFTTGPLFVGVVLSWWFWRSAEQSYKATLLAGSSGPEWK